MLSIEKRQTIFIKQEIVCPILSFCLPSVKEVVTL